MFRAHPKLRRSVGIAAWTAAGLVLSACRDGQEPQVTTSVDRETFIATYVDLRSAVVDGNDTVIPEATRDEILRRHGVSQEDLLAFAEAHGTDLSFMREVWDEVERRLNPLDVPPDSVEAEGGG